MILQSWPALSLASAFDLRPNPTRAPAPPDPVRIAQAEDIAQGFDNPALSAAMRQLALNILSRRDINDRKANP